MRTGKTYLISRTVVRYLLAVFLVGLFLFVPAGTLSYWNAWVYLASLFIPMLAFLVYLAVKAPELLEKRLKTKEREPVQRTYQKLSLVPFFMAFVLPGLDYRFSWSYVPTWLVVVSVAAVLAGYLMFVVVLIQNRYAARTVEIQEKQVLINTGLYSVVRHPLYLSASILFLFSPLVLGSFYALIPMLFLPLLLVIRIKNEEQVLRRGLTGYEAYMKAVRWRLLPFVW